jgi:hypothetical protein
MRPPASVKKTLFDIQSYTGVDGAALMAALQMIVGVALPLKTLPIL